MGALNGEDKSELIDILRMYEENIQTKLDLALRTYLY